MLIKPLTSLTLATASGLLFAASADASPRFTIENTTDSKVEVDIFNGDDAVCYSHAKDGKILPGKTKSFGCKGNGKGRCKVKLYSNYRPICRDERDTCDGKAIKLQGGSTTKIVVRRDKTGCDIE